MYVCLSATRQVATHIDSLRFYHREYRYGDQSEYVKALHCFIAIVFHQ